MDISIIEELRKISNEEIKLLNDLNDSIVTKEEKINGIVELKKYERFIRRDFNENKYAEIIYMIMGSSIHTIDDEVITLKENELLFINKDAHHKVSKLGNDDIAVRIIIDEKYLEQNYFENDYLVNCFLKTLFEKELKMSFIRFNIETVKSAINILENMIFSMLKKENVSEITNVLYMNLFFEHLKNEYAKLKFSSNAKDVKVTLNVIKFIDENLKDGELKDIADSLAITPYSLSKTLKKMTGHNFKELLQIKKLDTALYLLNNTDMPITEISREIGYENTSYFHKIFKAKYDVSPKKYRD